ncbi:MAG: hypothetical protein UY97_C0022G0004 [Parcubacteria group bacterium GW2011_GWB1_57_6]|nr:MAG: hypothetical protein UY93_C0002G0126 [Parcubacteria group bacterium GW2011_GWA1_56_13]KKW45427.1 MAG: hypothetical protein UY97_C0022G0004 [Parcubacteria group bacterium GW2011_GWB1_57_6]
MITTFVAIAMPVTMLAPFTPPEITDALRDVSIDWVSFLALALLAALVAGAVVSFKQAAD